MTTSRPLFIATLALAGAMLGGGLAGYADLHRQMPRASHASDFVEVPHPECDSIFSQYSETVTTYNAIARPMDLDAWCSAVEEVDRIKDGVISCFSSICTARDAEVIEAGQEWENAVDARDDAYRAADDARDEANDYFSDVLQPAYEAAVAADNAYQEYYASLPDEITAEQQAELTRLEHAAEEAAQAQQQAQSHYDELGEAEDQLRAEGDQINEGIPALLERRNQLSNAYHATCDNEGEWENGVIGLDPNSGGSEQCDGSGSGERGIPAPPPKKSLPTMIGIPSKGDY